MLVLHEGVDPEAVQAALAIPTPARERIGETLVRKGVTTPEGVARCLAKQLAIPFVPAPISIDPDAFEALDPTLVLEQGIAPLAIDSRSIRIAVADPLDLRAADDVRFQTGRRVDLAVATPHAISEAHRNLPRPRAARHMTPVGVLPAGARPEDAPTSAEPAVERLVAQAPVVRLVDGLLRDAIDAGASDIHIEETGKDVRIRLRVDGTLRQTAELPAAIRRAVLSRIKIIAGMDIAVRRRAQDGRLKLDHGGRTLGLRVSTLPVNGGEKAVVRILDSTGAPDGLHQLGLSPNDLALLRRLVRRGEGVLLAAGPTGSGKSTTLFAALSEIDRERQNVVTLEDPVEYRLVGASQIQVDSRAGLTFAGALRALLRQDPDVIMVGEIRDRETAEIAMAAAVTGHLVLSTIHTTDAPGAVTRLLHMGVPPFLVAGGLSGVVAQRLVRSTCTECRGRGCEKCDAGLRGRTGVYQVLEITDAIRDEISGGASSARIRRLATEAGMRSLGSDARRAIAEGLTTPHEVTSVLDAVSATGVPCSECTTTVPYGAKGCPACGAQRLNSCACGQSLDRGWRFCPWCIRKAGCST